MTVQKAVRHEADNPKTGITLDELAAFVQEAMREEIPGTTAIKVTVNMRGGIKKATIET